MDALNYICTCRDSKEEHGICLFEDSGEIRIGWFYFLYIVNVNPGTLQVDSAKSHFLQISTTQHSLPLIKTNKRNYRQYTPYKFSTLYVDFSNYYPQQVHT